MSAEPTTKKARTRARIVGEAAKILREKGIAGASVDEIMEAAELTRGGFYAHFTDKNALVAEALALAFQEARQALFSSPDERRGRRWVEAAASRYLSKEHLAEPAMRCPLPPLTGEIARADALVRAVFTKNVIENVALAERLSGARGKHARAYVVRTLCAWLGALMVARAVDDEAFASEILEATRAESLRDYDARMTPKKRQRTQLKSRKPASAQKRYGENQ